MQRLLNRPPFRWEKIVRDLHRRYPCRAKLPLALVSVATQCLYLVNRMHLVGSYRISTSRFGTGSRWHSFRTPLGVHRVCQKIGEGCELLTLFKERKPVGKCAMRNLFATVSQHDAVCTRILWFDGLETGFNRSGYVDSARRRIYIHGTIDEQRIGRPSSIGCIRMNNDNVIEVFDALNVDSLVYVIGDSVIDHCKRS